MIINNKHKFVYLDTPKTASLWLDTYFESIGGTLVRPPGDSALRFKHCREIPREVEGYTRIASVRNPYSRALSFFNFTELRGVNPYNTFVAFLEHAIRLEEKYEDSHRYGPEYVRFSQSKYLRPMGYDKLIRQESLIEDLKALGYPESPLINQAPMNKGSKKKVNVTRKEKLLIERLHRQDFEEFGYERRL